MKRSATADDYSGITPNRFAYMKRERAVYQRGEPSCAVRGPTKARCVLEPGHPGNMHEGNGFDEWGPLYRIWRGTV